MKKAFRSAFITSTILAIITLPAIFIGFWPATLLMIVIAIVSLIGWIVSKAVEVPVAAPNTMQTTNTQPVDTSSIVVGNIENTDTKSQQSK